MKKTFLIMSVIFVAAVTLAAQDYKGRGRVSGYVTDEEGKPIEGVKVRLFSLKAQEGFEVNTDKGGKWVAAWIRSGGWNVDFECAGYEPKKISMDISESKKNPDVVISLRKVEGLVVTDDIRDRVTEGNSLFEQGKYDEAAALFQKILEQYPDTYPIYRNLGNCYFAQEKYDLAEENYQKVLEKDPGNAEAIIAIGNCYSNRGDTAKALEWYGKVDFEKIEDPVVLYNLGITYGKNGQYEDALKCYQKAVDKNKNFQDARYQLGLTYISLQKNAEAVATFEEFLNLYPESPQAGQVRGFLDYLKKK
jgi:tetratricopeptide (TPR) repeat protein